MPLTRRPSRLVVTFTGFHVDIPSLSLPGFGMSDDRFRDRIRRHVRPYLYARHEDIQVEGGMDVPHGSVRVKVPGPSEEGVAGRITVRPESEDRVGDVRGGIPPWVWVGVLVFIALVLFF